MNDSTYDETRHRVILLYIYTRWQFIELVLVLEEIQTILVESNSCSPYSEENMCDRKSTNSSMQ